MKRQDRKHKGRLRNIAVATTLTALILSVSTYAWFIGMKTVNVSSFDVEIASTESLLLSLDGKKWSNTVSISKDTLDTVSYTGHTNTWGNGLIPVSSIGDMDSTASRMKLFEKASLTATPGGYRLLASRMSNTGATEQDGYVAFDLFVHNFSGTQYIPELDKLDEEAIYLTTDSSVTVAETGVENTGIENSVRVAFAQIGRVVGTTTNDTKITGITCNNYLEASGPSELNANIVDGVTGICRTAQIWEPNDTKHVSSAISWYNTSCSTRKTTGTDVTLPGSFNVGTACGTVTDGNSYSTYAVKQPITSANNVDIYDGADYNGYAGSAAYLESYNYFTDTEKMLTGTSRPTFMTLSPNSITKIRVYVYIEGQDVDNYDFAQIGKKIAVKFGFTKERYTQGDIGYDGPAFTTPTE